MLCFELSSTRGIEIVAIALRSLLACLPLLSLDRTRPRARIFSCWLAEKRVGRAEDESQETEAEFDAAANAAVALANAVPNAGAATQPDDQHRGGIQGGAAVAGGADGADERLSQTSVVVTFASRAAVRNVVLAVVAIREGREGDSTALSPLDAEMLREVRIPTMVPAEPRGAHAPHKSEEGEGESTTVGRAAND
eukprot:SAG11_NODE_2947_length_2820_cov_1.771408_2_plen_195_part_00